MQPLVYASYLSRIGFPARGPPGVMRPGRGRGRGFVGMPPHGIPGMPPGGEFPQGMDER